MSDNAKPRKPAAFLDQFQGIAQILDRVVICKQADRLPRGPAIVIDRFFMLIGECEVIGKQAKQSVQPVGVNGFHGLTHTLVKRAAAFDQNCFVNSFLGERIAERIFDLRYAGGFPDQLQP